MVPVPSNIMSTMANEHTPMLKDRDSTHNMCTYLLRCNRFNSLEVESLYQRYVFKLQQSATACLLILLTFLCLSLALLTTLYVKTYTIYSIYLYAQGFIFLLFFTLIKIRAFKEQHFTSMNYAILFFVLVLGVMSSPLPLGGHKGGVAAHREGVSSQKEGVSSHNTSDVRGSTHVRHAPIMEYTAMGNSPTMDTPMEDTPVEYMPIMSEGSWLVALLVFYVYALMPLKTWTKCVSGALLPLAHVLISLYTCRALSAVQPWRQVSVCLLDVYTLYISGLRPESHLLYNFNQRTCIAYIQSFVKSANSFA